MSRHIVTEATVRHAFAWMSGGDNVGAYDAAVEDFNDWLATVTVAPSREVVDALQCVADCAEDVLNNCVPDPDEEGPATDLRAALASLAKAVDGR